MQVAVLARKLRVRAAIASANRKREYPLMQSFSELPLSPYTQERLSLAKFSTPTPIQAAAIPQALAGKDVLATAQTGTGKTLAFLIPVIERLLKQNHARNFNALVLVPTRELAMQVVDAVQRAARQETDARRRWSSADCPKAQQLPPCAKAHAWWSPLPGRLEDFLDRRLIHFQALQMLILDEADRMLDMGFLPAIRTHRFGAPEGAPDPVLLRNPGSARWYTWSTTT